MSPLPPDLLADCVAFIRRLIQTPSLSFAEHEVAQLVMREMRAQGVPEVWQDGMGNVFGRIPGHDRTLPAIVLNTHLDHVDPGDVSLWPSPPYAAEIVDGHIVGRGAVDIKGPLGVQVYSLIGLLRAGTPPRRDVVFGGVVQEEIGGAGAIYWAQQVDYPVGLIILGEPSDNNVMLGHRGIRPIWVTFFGRSAHASAPAQAINPNYALAAFLHRLATAQHDLPRHPRLGPTTVSPTLIEVDTKSSNVTPAWTRVYLDFRSAAATDDDLVAFIQKLAGGAPYSLSYPHAATEPPRGSAVITGFDTHPDDPAAQRASALLTEGMGRAPTLGHYRFATDGRHFTHLGALILGYAPGAENQAHIAGERIALAAIEEALSGHLALLPDW